MYIYCNKLVSIVPYEETDDQIRFKTVYPSRRATKEYWKLKGNQDGSSS